MASRIPLVSRRSLFLFSWPLLLSPRVVRAASIQQGGAEPSGSGPVSASFPAQDPDLVREMVGASHGQVAKVRQLVGRQQTLAKAVTDWGFGDWESALGAASHVGNREIAEFLLANGARPTLFSAAMLGQLDVVKAFVAASPGVQRIRGPHSITLLSHAKAGGAQAKPVLDYLAELGGADESLPEKPLTAEEQARILGSYVFGTAPGDRIEATLLRDMVQIARQGHPPRVIRHLGSYEFYPVGAENVRIRFTQSSSGLTLTVHDPGVVLTARKTA